MGSEGASRYWVKLALVAGAYFATAKLGLQLAFAHASITAVWPPTGIALAALVVWGPRMWPGVALGAALANATTGNPPIESVLGITVGNTLEALVGAYLLVNVAQFRPSLDRVRDVLALALLAGGLSTMVSATIGVASLWLGGQIGGIGDVPSAWRVWWLGDLGGDLLVAPVLLVLASGARPSRDRGRMAEAALLLATLVGVSILVFSRDLPLTYLIFPPLIWAALRFRQLEASAGEPDRGFDRRHLHPGRHGAVRPQLTGRQPALRADLHGSGGHDGAAADRDHERAAARRCPAAAGQ